MAEGVRDSTISLAVELAAARAGLISPAEILSRLGRRPRPAEGGPRRDRR